MIGLSLSLCVMHIVDGSVRVDGVEKIVTGTKAERGTDAWNKLIDEYMKTYWNGFNRKDVMGVLDALIIEQPRLVKSDHFPMIDNGVWVTSENDIVWFDEL